jgi:RNA polymerase sigma-70 factor (ECF subfamily)
MTHQALKTVSTDPPEAREWDWAEVRLSCLRVTRQFLRCPGAAEDAAQDAVLRVWLSSVRPPDLDNPGAWVSRIARNEALRLQARVSRRREVVAYPEQQVDAAEIVEEVLDRVAIEALLARLTAAERELYRLRYRDDLTEASVANHLGIPHGTAKVRLHRLRRRLAALT